MDASLHRFQSDDNMITIEDDHGCGLSNYEYSVRYCPDQDYAPMLHQGRAGGVDEGVCAHLRNSCVVFRVTFARRVFVSRFMSSRVLRVPLSCRPCVASRFVTFLSP